MDKSNESEGLHKNLINERIQNMREKMRGMTLLQKIDYLWTYYKIWLLVPVGIGIVIYMGCSIYRTKTENILVNAVVVGSTLRSTEELSQDVKEYMGEDGRHDVVTVQTNIPDDNMGQASMVALSTVVGAETVDVIVCPEKVYEHFSSQDGFEDMSKLFGETGQKEGLELTEEGDALKITDSKFLQEKLGTPYKEVYIGVLINAPHEKGADQFVQYVLEKL